MARGRRVTSTAYDMRPSFVKVLKSEASLSSTYTRGRDIASFGRVSSCSYYEEDGQAQVVGKVRGSMGAYDVSVTLDLDMHEVEGHSCTCPAHATYYGMCKHTIALALTYLCGTFQSNVRLSTPCPLTRLDAPPTGSVPTANPATRTAGPKPAPATRQRPKPKPKSKPQPKTSPEISKVISNYAGQSQENVLRLAALAPTASPEQEEPVRLECILREGEGAWSNRAAQRTWTLGFRISRGKTSYVVKDTRALVDAWRNGEMFTYGKNLAFVHRRSAFTEQTNQLLERLAPLIDAQDSYYRAEESRYYSTHGYLGSKEVPLSTAQLAELLRLLVGETVTYERDRYDAYSYGKERVGLSVVEQDPRPSVRIAPKEGAWELTVEPAEAECVSDDRACLFVTDKQLHICSDGFARELGPFLHAVLPLSKPLTITKTSMPGFCAAALPALSSRCELDAPDDLATFAPPPAELSFRIGLEDGKVSCEATVTYGEESLPLYADVYERQPTRDVEREMAAQQLVDALFPLGDHRMPNYGQPHQGSRPKGELHRPTWFAYRIHADEQGVPWFDKDDDEAYYLLFSEGLDALSQMGEVLLSERLRTVSVRQAPDIQVEANVSGGLLDLEVTADGMSPQELMDYLASYRRRQRFVRLDNGDIVRLDGSIAAVAGLADGLGIDDAQLVEGTGDLPANRTLFVDAMLKRTEGVGFSRNAAFRKIVRDFETVADADFTLPKAVHAKLRPYQTEGFRWLCTLGTVDFGGILADDMGLGKTLQAIAYLAYAREQGAAHPALVVCPASLVYNWASELERFAPDLEVAVVAGTKRERTSAIAAAADYDVLVSSYDLMKRDIDAYEAERFSCVVLDEAHYIKTPTTLVARAAKRLPADMRLALTGTPIENRLSELWSIFDFLMPGVLGTRDSFSRRFSSPIAGGDDAAAERLRKLVSPFILRRLKRDVLRDLPEKSESVVTSVLVGEQRKLYRASAEKLRLQLEQQLPEEFAGMRLQVLAELTRLRQICCDPSLAFENYKGGSAKLDTCIELVQSALAGGHQMLVFSQFTTMLDRIAARLDGERVGYLMLTGSTSKEERQRLVARFQAGEAPVFLISLKAGGVGLNLTAADIVVHFDPWWNVAAEDQATDRTHRIGQTREVSVFKLIAKDTIEEKIVEMQQAKRALADAVIGGEGVGSGSITRDDILALLEG